VLKSLHRSVYAIDMELKKYWKKLSPVEREQFANRCGTTFGMLRNVVYGKTPGESLCINIERESGRQVTCEELRDDVDWAYLRGTRKKAA
jgi:DNA-binding transcriptional regulator YdaS (Cro superfamily)